MTTLIVASKCGQLGNRLVLGGHLVALAAEHGFRVLNIAFADYAQYFMGTESSACCTFPERQRRLSIPQAREYAFRVSNVTARALRRLHVDNRITRTFVSWPYNAAEDLDLSQPDHLDKIHATSVCFLLGWQFRNYELFHKHADAIRHYFRPVESIQANVEKKIAAARARGECVVGVHIRQGDYATYQNGEFFRPTETYAAVMRRLVELLRPRQPCFVITSHVPQDPRHFEGLNWMLADGNLVEDMYLLAQCDLVLAVPSTFSRWACFYGKKPLAFCPAEHDRLTLDDFVVPLD
jgi:Glycosyl transferase family 11